MQPQTVSVMKKCGAGIAEGTGDVIAEIIGTDAGNAMAVFYLSNHCGDTLAAYRGSSTLVAKYRYDAFGNQRTDYCVVNESQYAPRFTFSTKEYLPTPANGGMYLCAYRVYDPVVGRWTQRDPIDYQDSMNLYQFCGNNPISKCDPDGRVAIADDAAVATLVVVGGLAVIGVWLCTPIGQHGLKASADYVYQQARNLADATSEQAKNDYNKAKRFLQDQVDGLKKELQKLNPKDPRWRELWRKLKQAQEQVKECLKRPRKDTTPHTDGRQPKGVGGNK